MKTIFIKYCLIPVMLLSVGTSTLFAGKNEFAFGSKDYYAIHRAKRDAKRNTNGCLWFSAGFLLDIFGVGAALIDDPIPKESALIGKSPEYIARYTEAYKAESKRIETRYAVGGCLVLGVVYGALVVVYSN